MKTVLFKTKKMLLILLSILIILESLLAIPLPYISKFLIDDVIGKGNYEKTELVFIVFLIFLFLQFTSSNFLTRVTAKIEVDLIKFIRQKIIISILSKRFISDDDKSRAQEIILNDIETYVSNILTIFYALLSNLLKIIGCVTIILQINFWLGVVCLVFVPVYVFWTIFISNKLKNLTYIAKNNRDNLIHTTVNILYNHLTVKIYNLFQLVFTSFKLVVNENATTLKRIKIYSNIVSIISNLIITSATFLPIFIGINLVKNNILTVGDLIAFNAYIGMLFSPITAIISTITTIKLNSVYHTRITEFLSGDGYINTSFSTKSTINTLIMKNVNLFVDDQKIVESINLELKSGDIIQVKGDNGSGKSLFLKSMINLNEFSGDIIFNGIDIKEKTIEQLSNEIVYVSNELGFVGGKLIENIPGTEEIKHIFEIVNLSSRLKKIENLFDFAMENIVNEFSSGELQKLKIARALNKKPKVLLLDEMFSHISKNDSSMILENISSYLPDAIIILVEHHYASEIVTQVYKINQRKIVKV